MSLYKDYCDELQHVTYIGDDSKFATFRVIGKEFVIVDFYIKPSHRNNQVGISFYRQLEDRAKQLGCTLLSAKVDIVSKKSLESLIFHQKCSLKIAAADKGVIYTYKELI